MPDLPEVDPSSQRKWLAIGALAVLLGLVLRAGWVTEDAYITLRTVDNWIHGHGLRWNTDERVQAYTHPLWMLVLSAAYLVTRESFVTTVFTGVLVTAVAATTMVRFSRSAGHAAAAVLLLALSRAFVEFSTSGLENPLSHLGVALFVGLFATRRTPLRWLSLVAALIALNRMDAILVVAPSLGYAVYEEVKLGGWKWTVQQLAIGFAPLFAWEVFSVVYYGFPFPNTAYAKLNTGLPRLEVLRQGVTYWFNSLAWDPAVHIITALGVATAIWQRQRRELLIALGAVLYVLYVIWIGGDFMHGRFWTLPFFTAVCVISISRLPLEEPLRAGAIVLPFFLLFHSPAATESYPISTFQHSGIADERLYYREFSSLMMFTRYRNLPTHTWVQLGKDIHARNEQGFVFDNIGYLGFFAGPTMHIVDQLALSEPLLARIPMRYRATWRVGHFSRHIPEGYIETVKTGKCAMTDKNLCEYYGKLREVIAGDIFSWSRFKTLLAMNFGKYDYLIDRELYRYPEIVRDQLQNLSQVVPERAPWNAAGTRAMADDGVLIELGKLSHAHHVELSLDGNDAYDIEFRSGSTRLGKVESPALDRGFMHTRRIEVPERARKEGFDNILVRPTRGDGMYSVGYVRLREK